MSDLLELDQADLAARLTADAYFADVYVLLQRKGVTENEVLTRLGTLNPKSGKLGVIVIVLIPELDAQHPNAPGPQYDVVASIQVIEKPLLNLGAQGTGKSAESIAERVRMLLHHFHSGIAGVWAFTRMEPLRAGDGLVSYAATFTRAGGDAAPAKTATPTIAAAGALPATTVTLACATAAAAIYYTLDGSYPASTAEAAALYTAPFVVAVACTVRAAAEAAALLQSDVNAAALA